jgi:tetratricopeptide (TPR) repeat protein
VKRIFNSQYLNCVRAQVFSIFRFSMVIVISVLFLSFGSPRTLAQTPTGPIEAMLAANRNYEAGQFDEAIAAYEAIVAAGISNSNVYYNLGNAYFKQGNLGRAILNYRRAYRLDPRDRDITFNLEIARAQTVDQLRVTEEGILADWVQIAEEWLTLSEAGILALVLWVLICVLAILGIQVARLRRFSRISIAILAIFLVIGVMSIANRFYAEQRFPPAVIVAQEVDVTSGPGTSEQYLVEFGLHAGAEVRIQESRPGWNRISLSGDLQGWVPNEAIELVIDR